MRQRDTNLVINQIVISPCCYPWHTKHMSTASQFHKKWNKAVMESQVAGGASMMSINDPRRSHQSPWQPNTWPRLAATKIQFPVKYWGRLTPSCSRLQGSPYTDRSCITIVSTMCAFSRSVYFQKTLILSFTGVFVSLSFYFLLLFITWSISDGLSEQSSCLSPFWVAQVDARAFIQALGHRIYLSAIK